MGRVKGTLVKRFAHDLVKKFPSAFSKDFAHNKAEIKKMGLIAGKEMNKLAGEVTTTFRKITQSK